MHFSSTYFCAPQHGASLRQCQLDSSLSLIAVLELRLMQPGISAIGCQQFDMSTALNDMPVLHDQNEIGLLDGAQAMSDDQCGPTRHHTIECALDMSL